MKHSSIMYDAIIFWIYIIGTDLQGFFDRSRQHLRPVARWRTSLEAATRYQVYLTVNIYTGPTH